MDTRTSGAAVLSRRSVLLVLILVPIWAALAACGRHALVTHYYGSGIFDLFQYAASWGPVPTVVVGNPFPEETAAVERAVTDAFRSARPGLAADFAAASPEPGSRRLRLVVAFNPPVSLGAGALCSDAVRIAPDANALELRAMTVFCAGDAPQVVVWATAAPARSVHDPNVAETLRQVLVNLLPGQDPHRSDCQGQDC